MPTVKCRASINAFLQVVCFMWELCASLVWICVVKKSSKPDKIKKSETRKKT